MMWDEELKAQNPQEEDESNKSLEERIIKSLINFNGNPKMEKPTYSGMTRKNSFHGANWQPKRVKVAHMKLESVHILMARHCAIGKEKES